MKKTIVFLTSIMVPLLVMAADHTVVSTTFTAGGAIAKTQSVSTDSPLYGYLDSIIITPSALCTGTISVATADTTILATPTFSGSGVTIYRPRFDLSNTDGSSAGTNATRLLDRLLLVGDKLTATIIKGSTNTTALTITIRYKFDDK